MGYPASGTGLCGDDTSVTWPGRDSGGRGSTPRSVTRAAVRLCGDGPGIAVWWSSPTGYTKARGARVTRVALCGRDAAARRFTADRPRTRTATSCTTLPRLPATSAHCVALSASPTDTGGACGGEGVYPPRRRQASVPNLLPYRMVSSCAERSVSACSSSSCLPARASCPHPTLAVSIPDAPCSFHRRFGLGEGTRPRRAVIAARSPVIAITPRAAPSQHGHTGE